MQSDDYCSFVQKMVRLWAIKQLIHVGHQEVNTICHLD